MLRKIMIGAVMLVALAASPAAAQYQPIVVQPGQVEAGGAITVTGSTCKPFEHVTITISRAAEQKSARIETSGDPILVVETDADAEGNFSVTITIPDGTPVGTYVVESTSECVESATFDVIEPTQPTTPGTGGGNLGRTGSDLDKLGMAGAGLLVLGGLVLVATKRRRHETTAAAV